MKKKYLSRKLSKIITVVVLTGVLTISGCAGSTLDGSKTGETTSESQLTQEDAAGQADQSVNTTTGSGSVQTALASVTTLDVDDMFSKKDQSAEYQEAECILITLTGDAATCESDGVTVENGIVTIKKAGSYILRGSLTGSIRVEVSNEEKVQLILDGVSINTEGTACIYVKTADKVFITLAEGSTNTIVNTGTFVQSDDNNVDGAIFSKSDLTLNGDGSLTVSSEKGHGIVSKDDLKVTGGTYEIQAGNHGLSGKDSVRIADGTLTITCAEDGIHSGNDEDPDKGYVYIAGGNIKITADDDGIHGETKVVIGGGIIDIAKSYEGIEATIVEIAGGDITVTASDDGINASDGSGSEFGGPGAMGGFGGRGNMGGFDDQGDMGGFRGQRNMGGSGDAGESDGQAFSGQNANAENNVSNGNVYVLISGGRLVVNAKGDGIDSNGSLYVKGGEIYVSGPENNGNGALDYDTAGEITGGTLIAVGSIGMAMNFSNTAQGSALITLSSTHNAGELVELKDSRGNTLISYTPTGKFASVVVSCADMKQGETYTLTIGSETQEFTLEELLYGKSNGFGGMGGGGQRGGGFPGGQGNMPEGFDPNNGERPELPENFDGNFPNQENQRNKGGKERGKSSETN